jgi:hypothetical protein
MAAMTGVTAVAAAQSADTDKQEGLVFRLSEGKPALGEDPEKVPLGETTPLSNADADRVLARVKAVGDKPEDVQGSHCARVRSRHHERAGR